MNNLTPLEYEELEVGIWYWSIDHTDKNAYLGLNWPWRGQILKKGEHILRQVFENNKSLSDDPNSFSTCPRGIYRSELAAKIAWLNEKKTDLVNIGPIMMEVLEELMKSKNSIK